MDLCLKHNINCFMNLVGSRTQIGVSYASALLVPYWQIMSFFVHAGPVAWIMWFLLSVNVPIGSLDSFSLVASMLGFACQVVRVVFPTFAPCLEHVCAGRGGGVV